MSKIWRGAASALIGAVLAGAGPAVYSQASGEDAAVVVTAMRVDAQITDAIAHTSIITRRDIRDSQGTDLATLLRREAGIEILQNGGIGTQVTLSIRGSDPRQLQVLIDGVRAFTATQGTTAIEDIMLDQIERIEIVRGNVSSLYGSGASGGVVQIFTRRGAGTPRADVQLMAGSRGTGRASVNYGGASGETRFNIGASHTQSSSFSAIDSALAPRANPDKDGYRNQSVNASIERRIAEGHELGLRLFRAASDLEFDSAAAPATPNTKHTAENLLETFSLHAKNRISRNWISNLRLSQGRQYNENLTNGGGLTRFNTTNRQAAWQNDVTLVAQHVLSLALEFEQQRVVSTTAYARSARDVNTAWLAYNGRVGVHGIQASVRNDRYSDFGGASTHFLGYGFDLTPAWRATASTSTAFVAPTFNQLFFPGFGNPSLRPERARSVETGLQYAEAGQLVRLSMYRTRYRDLIETVLVIPPSTFGAQNVSVARVEGLELSYTGTIAGWDLRSSLTRQDPINLMTGTQLRRRGKAFGSLSANKSYGRWRVGGDLYMTDTRPDLTITGGRNVDLAAYTLVNLTARYAITPAAQISLKLENAFNEKYQLAHGFNTPSRGVFATLGWTH